MLAGGKQEYRQPKTSPCLPCHPLLIPAEHCGCTRLWFSLLTKHEALRILPAHQPARETSCIATHASSLLAACANRPSGADGFQRCHRSCSTGKKHWGLATVPGWWSAGTSKPSRAEGLRLDATWVRHEGWMGSATLYFKRVFLLGSPDSCRPVRSTGRN